ncbi:MAG: hypothetical protein V3U24_03595 [Candidatus Neomarinimicrobiota bacterium]
MISNRILKYLAAFAFVPLFLMVSCEREEDVTGPATETLRPAEAEISVDRSTILSGGRDSSHWDIKLFQANGDDMAAFESAYTLELLTDRHGYFLDNGDVARRITVTTDANGEASLNFYGSREPGISETLIWGEGFGPQTVTVSVVAGFPYYIVLEFKDPGEPEWMSTDSLVSGEHFSKPDSTMVRITILNEDQLPLEGVQVNLNNGSPAIGGGLYGYFKSIAPEKDLSYGSATTGVSGIASDFYYSDVVPVSGNPVTVEIVAQVDSARFGRIISSKFLTISPP